MNSLAAASNLKNTFNNYQPPVNNNKQITLNWVFRKSLFINKTQICTSCIKSGACYTLYSNVLNNPSTQTHKL